jgi:hypothetical protein
MIGLSMSRVRAGQIAYRAMALCALALGGTAVGCESPPIGTLLIVQNQIPALDSMSNACVFSADSTAPSLASGKFDVYLDQAYPYFVYPLIENELPSIQTAGVERNNVLLNKVRVAIKAPSGVDPHWEAGCPGTFDAPASGVMGPGSTRAVRVDAFRTCHAEHLKQMIADHEIPADLSQPVFFTLELTAIADRSGSEQKSGIFPFDVQVCAGCLQSMFPLTPACADAPKPNLLHGNPCNIAQDGPAVLCCTNPAGALFCPAPDQ